MLSYVFNVVKDKLFNGEFTFQAPIIFRLMLVKTDMFDNVEIPTATDLTYIENYEIDLDMIGDNYNHDGYTRGELQSITKDDIIDVNGISISTIKSNDISYETVSGLDAGGAVIYADTGIETYPVVALNFESKKTVEIGIFTIPLSTGFMRLDN